MITTERFFGGIWSFCVGWIAGVVVQLIMTDQVTGAATAIGNSLTGKD